MALEGVGIGVFGILVLSRVPEAVDLGVALGSGLLALAYGAVLLLVGRGVLRGRRWARGPGVATQLLQLLTAWSVREGSGALPVAAVAVAALVTLVCLLLPSSTAVFAERTVASEEPPSG
ncbi:MAG: hypothetical protein ACLGIF_02895 [Actinomycetes bacterium]